MKRPPAKLTIRPFTIPPSFRRIVSAKAAAETIITTHATMSERLIKELAFIIFT
jgi:hypothetical protein